MIAIILVALALSSHNCLASYYYQPQPQLQLQTPFAYNGYHPNYPTYQSTPAVQYYSSNHLQAPAPAPAPFVYQQAPTASYFQRTFLQPPAYYNVPPAPFQVQQPAPVVLRTPSPVPTLNATVLSAAPDNSPQMRGFIYHTDLQGGARSNVVFFSGPVPVDLFQTALAAPAGTSMRAPASDSVDTVAVDAAVNTASATAAPVMDHFQSLLALLNRQPSNTGGGTFVQDGILYSGNNRVVTNNRFLASEDQSEADEVLPILRSSFIGRRVTSAEAAEGPEASASERQSKSVEIDTATTTTTSAPATTTTTVASTTVTDAPSTATTAAAPSTTAASTSTTASSTTTTSTMAPIIVAEMAEA